MKGRNEPPCTKRGYAKTVITPWGYETYQVILDEAPPLWVARIVTLPNRVWASPNGREALKFHGSTADEAEQAAIDFLESERVLARRRVCSPRAALMGTVMPRQQPEESPKPAPRLSHRLLLRFGEKQPELPGLTANLSLTGLFIVTDRPARAGSSVQIDLRFPDGPVLLAGEAVWARTRRQEGGSLGFGVRLVARPVEYAGRLRNLMAAHSRRP